MKTTAKYIFNFMLTVLSAVMVCSCADDSLVENEEYGNRPVQVSFAVSFEPSAEALTRATAGNAIKDINWLAIVIYNENKELVNVLEYTSDNLTAQNIDRTPTGNQPTDYPGDKLSESYTPKVTPNQKPVLDPGKYYMYAVANVDEGTKQKIRSKSTDIDTPDKLKALQAVWNRTNIPSNSQMFGYFTPGTNGESVGFDAPLVTVDGNNLQFHAWVKRCASKVTIVYDGSGLHEDIFVYIHKVTIHDIPKTCYLGQKNQPVRDDEELWEDGESIYYNAAGQQLATSPTPSHSYNSTPEPATYQQWMRIGRGSDLKGAVEADGTTTHSETSTALYFYENAQGNYPDQQAYYKPQIWENVGTNVYEGDEDFKDNVVNGTYIEVEAYYVSKHAPGISRGKIKYRFMLGQDTQYDYNAFRNCHYKLTLKFKGYANQPDWHIEYIEEKPEIYTPDEFYVSYLYNREATFPMRIIGTCTNLEVEIIRNDWWPYDPTSSDEAPAQHYENSDEIFEWNREVWANIKGGTNYSTTTSGGYRYGKHKVSYTYNGTTDTTLIETPPYVGFLSLTVPTEYENTSTTLPANIFGTSGTDWYSYDTSMNGLKNYYAGNSPTGTNINTVPQNKRTLDILTDGTKGNGRNAYTVSSVSDGSTLIELPLWTRPFSMILISGFSGNNPYEAYQRKALLRIRGQFTMAGERVFITKTVPVYQVRRIFNPKGVWRKYNNNDPFHVTLMQRRDETVSTFSSFESEGPWRAEIKTSTKDFCYLDSTDPDKIDGDAIVGETGEHIEFDIKFRGNTTATESNCAVILVKYHSLNCEHVIFVRQGYDEPLEIVSGQGRWSSYSLYAAYNSNSTSSSTSITKPSTAVGVLTKSPLALGSFFKRGNYDDAIITSNNETYPRDDRPGDGTFVLRWAKKDGTGVRTRTAKTWGDIVGIPYNGTGANTTYEWANFNVQVEGVTRTYSLPTIAQYTALQNSADVGFGVLYADGATETASEMSDAYGYIDSANDGHTSTKGMRGVMAYNKTNAHQVFFPVGSSGVGRRTIQGTSASSYGTTYDYNGVLRYGAVAQLLTVAQNSKNEYRPICYNLPNNAGAIYWAKKAVSNGNIAWDINLADQNFAPYDYACAFGNQDGSGGTYGDALPIKLIYIP